jgi:hypothetical protein
MAQDHSRDASSCVRWNWTWTGSLRAATRRPLRPSTGATDRASRLGNVLEDRMGPGRKPCGRQRLWASRFVDSTSVGLLLELGNDGGECRDYFGAVDLGLAEA